MQNESLKGIIAMAVACLVWGFSALYYKALAHIPPLEILAHRTLWSFVIFAGLLAVQGRLAALKGAVNTPRAAFIIGLAALMISVNWFSFIFSIQVGRATEAALGYYIFPLVAVLLGRIVFGERLGVVQWLAVALATGAVSLLTYGLGVAPWISLIVAFTFGLYGVVKKQLDIGPVVSVTAEVGMLVPVALVVLAVVHMRGQGHFGSAAWESGMLVFAGLLTALPLMLFSYATKRLQLSTVGLLQYINPSAQFFCAVVVFGEPFSGWHQLAFAMIWAGLLLYSLAALLQDRAARR
ncbi:EamA family transporter RarD [Lentibacter algarum]|uniref:EamA family transporter RarD n=1 Tax=Lentibacter algarum TaxID=576131 RepID=UPI00339D43BC